MVFTIITAKNDQLFMQEHGSFELKLKGQLIVLTAFGAWNLETALRMCEEYKLLAATIEDAPWACIVDLSNWELGIPDIWKLVDETNEWGNIHNLKFEAVICSLNLQKKMLEKSHEVFTNVETKFCENLLDAHSWLDSVGIN